MEYLLSSPGDKNLEGLFFSLGVSLASLLFALFCFYFRRYPLTEKTSEFLLYVWMGFVGSVIFTLMLGLVLQTKKADYVRLGDCTSTEKKCEATTKEHTKDLLDSSRNNLTASETIIFGTFTILLFILFTLWDSFNKSFRSRIQGLAAVTNGPALTEATRDLHSIQTLSTWAGLVFKFYFAFVIVVTVAVFGAPAILPYWFPDPFDTFALTQIIKGFTGLSVLYGLIFLASYIRLVHPLANKEY